MIEQGSGKGAGVGRVGRQGWEGMGRDSAAELRRVGRQGDEQAGIRDAGGGAA